MYDLITKELEKNLKRFTISYYLLYKKTIYIYECLIFKKDPNLRIEILEIFYHLKNNRNISIEIYLEERCKNIHLKIFLIYILGTKLNEGIDSKVILNNIRTKYGNTPEFQIFKFNLKKINTLLDVAIPNTDIIPKVGYNIHVNKFISDEMFDFIDINFIGSPPKEVIFNSFDDIIVRICISGGVLYHSDSNNHIFLEKGDILISNQLFFNKLSLLTPQSNILIYQIKNNLLINNLSRKIKENSAKKLKIFHFENIFDKISHNSNDQILLILKLLLDIAYYHNSPDDDYNLKFLNNFDFMKILEYIDLNLEKNISVKILEKKFNIYNSALIKLFWNYLGVLPSDYLFKQKLMRAAILLKTTSYKVNYISEILSFSSSSTFSIAFKTLFGVTPLKYRNKEGS